VDKQRNVIFSYLTDISSRDKKLMGDLRKISYLVEDCKKDMFTKQGYEKNAYLRYITINTSFLESFKQTLIDCIETGRDFESLVRRRVGFWIIPLELARERGGMLSKRKEEELEDVEGLFPEEEEIPVGEEPLQE